MVNTTCLCITGTDTDAGKTIVTAALARAAVAKGLRTLVIKPVQTGSVSDLVLCREAAPSAQTLSFAQFTPACSPHLAARLESRSEKISLTVCGMAENINRAVREANPCPDLVLLEGAGGLLTPLNTTETLADLFALLGWPVLLTAANKLGAVNHALLSLEVLLSRNLNCPGFIMTQTQEAQNELETVICMDNLQIITSLGKKPCLAELPYLPGLNGSNIEDREKAWDKAAQKLAPVIDVIDHFALRTQKINTEEDAELLRFDREHLWHP